MMYRARCRSTGSASALTITSGPIPAGSPMVIAIVGRKSVIAVARGGAIAQKRIPLLLRIGLFLPRLLPHVRDRLTRARGRLWGARSCGRGRGRGRGRGITDHDPG